MRVHLLKLGTVKMEEGLRVEETTGESLGSALLWLPRNVLGKKGAQAGLLLAHWEVKVRVIEVSQGGAAFSSLESQRKRGPWRRY